MQRLPKSVRSWRQVVAGVLMYALVVQGMAFALTNARLNETIADNNWVVCHHDGGASELPGNAPESPSRRAHCIFCLAGAAFVLSGPAPRSDIRVVSIAAAAWPLLVWQLPAHTVDAATRPRGPPPVA